MSDIEKLIFKMFKNNWVGEETTKNIHSMKKQLHKNLSDQIDGYWSGSTAYYIMTKGGFLIDSKSGTKKKLSSLGQMFMDEYKSKAIGIQK